MDYSSIDTLLEKYWQGGTSLKEEEKLKDFFSNSTNELPPHLAKVAPLFRYFANEKTRKLNDSKFDERLFEKLNKTKKPKHIKLPEATPNWYLKIAAALVILVGLGYVIQQRITPAKPTHLAWTQDTYQNPELAYAETKKALMMLSINFNQGKKEASKLALFNQAEQKIKNVKK